LRRHDCSLLPVNARRPAIEHIGQNPTTAVAAVTAPEIANITPIGLSQKR
jgi:hypothetical protein